MKKIHNDQDSSIIGSATSYFSNLGGNFFGKKEAKDEAVFSEEALVETHFENPIIVEIEEIIDQQDDVKLLLIEITDAQKTSFLKAIAKSTTKGCDDMKNGLLASWDYGLIKAANLKKSSIETAQTAGISLTSLTKDLGVKYKQMEIMPKVAKLINVLDLLFVIASLEALKLKYRKGSKESLAFSVLIGVLSLLESAKGSKVEDGDVRLASTGVTESMADLFKNVSLKSAIETAEPFLLLIPNGNYILLILRLFI